MAASTARRLALPRTAVTALALLALLLPLAGRAAAHEEREVRQPAGTAPPAYRDTGPQVVVCKPDSGERIATLPDPIRARNQALLDDCAFHDIQAAVTDVRDNGQAGTRILVLPGVYRELPSRKAHDELNGAPIGHPELADQCGQIAASTEALTYEQQATCPHLQNLIGVFGDQTPADDDYRCDSNLCDLQIEGTGSRPEDVIIDGKLNGILNGLRADRADGIYMKNFMTQGFEFNGIYVIETNGATADSVTASFNHEYGFLSFESFMRYENCDGQANGDSSFYPGASPDTNRDLGLIPLHRADFKPSTEVRGCRGHHNALGYSGTTGNSTFVHHNEFDHNATGFATDSLFPGHPGTPQNHALLEDNVFHENNSNFYDMTAKQGVCSKPMNERDYNDGAVCPSVPLPVGTGIIFPGSNFNWVHRNMLYDNWRTGTFQLWVPAEIREGGPDPDAHNQTTCGPDGDQPCPPQEQSHWDTYSANRLAEQQPFSYVQPNGADFTWDVEGQGNCWAQTGDEANTSAAGDVTYHPLDLEGFPTLTNGFPDCTNREQTYTPTSTNFAEAPCIEYDQADNPDPQGCDWFHTPAVPAARQPNAATLERLAGSDRIETAIKASQEGYPSDATTVVLARSDAYPDALAGAPLAHARGGPLLLTGSAGLDARVASEIQRLHATNAILLGGEQALSPTVIDDLRGLGFRDRDIVRIAGKDRFATSVAIARNLPASSALVAKGADANGQGWPDALAASSAAALLQRPILLTAPDTLPQSVSTFLDEGSIDSVDVIGGTAAVSDAVSNQLKQRMDDVERVAGANRYETSLAVAKFALKAGADPTELWLATGSDWPDGIAAGSAIAVDEGIMLLVGDTVAGTPVATWLDDVNPTYDTSNGVGVGDVLERVRILGGTKAVPKAVADDMTTIYGAVAGDARGDRSTGNTLHNGRLAGQGVAGSARVATTLVGSTRVWLEAAGLTAGTRYQGRVGTGTCAAGGGSELKPGGASFDLAPTADGAGTVLVDDTIFAVASGAARSVQLKQGSTVVGCADLG